MELAQQEKEQITHVMGRIERDNPGAHSGNLVVSGSGSMVMHGIDRGKTIGDIDIFTTTEMWLRMHDSPQWLTYAPSTLDHERRFDPAFLYQKVSFNLPRTENRGGVDTMDVNVFSDWRLRDWGNITLVDLFGESVEIDRVRCVGMEWLLAWKRSVERPKDMADIKLIEEWMEE